MAYDTYLAERIRQYFTEQQLNFFEKKMMGGLVFMLNDKMCCGFISTKNETATYSWHGWEKKLLQV